MAGEVEDGLRTLTVKQLAQATGIQSWRIFQMVKTGELPHFRLGKCIRFRVRDIEAWMDEQTNNHQGS